MPAILIGSWICPGFVNNHYTHQTSSSHPYISRRQHISLFAKKNKKKPKRAAQTTKGFGAPPPKLEDVFDTFKSRLRGLALVHKDYHQYNDHNAPGKTEQQSPSQQLTCRDLSCLSQFPLHPFQLHTLSL